MTSRAGDVLGETCCKGSVLLDLGGKMALGRQGKAAGGDGF